MNASLIQQLTKINPFTTPESSEYVTTGASNRKTKRKIVYSNKKLNNLFNYIDFEHYS